MISSRSIICLLAIILTPTAFSSSIHYKRVQGAEKKKQNVCFLKMIHAPGMNPLIRTDKNGKTCRINLTIPVCRGFCPTYEYGTHEFPHRSQKSEVCVPEGGKFESITLTECDDDADPMIRTVTVLRGAKCVCKACDKTLMNCMKNSLFN
ncbi:Cystine-knot domain family protein [Brugia pahangi]